MSRCVRLALAVACWLPLAGCPDTDRTVAEARDQRSLSARVQDLEKELAERDATIARQNSRLAELERIGSARADLVPRPARIELDSLSGGYDSNNDGRHEGIVAYVRPFDADGDVLKAPGAIHLQALDMAAEGGGRLLAECTLDEAATRLTWYSRFMTGHYTVRCPWQRAPEREAVTIRVVFTDALGGVRFEAIRQVKVRPPVAAAAPSDDAR